MQAGLPHPDTRARILAGLFEALAEKGTRFSSVTEIAKAAGVSRGVLHYHFTSTEAVRLALFETLGQRYLAGLEKALQECPDVAALGPAMVRYHLGVQGSPSFRLLGVWIGFWGEAPSSPDMRGAVETIQGGARDSVARALCRLTHRSADDVEPMAAAIVALVEGAVLQWRVAAENGALLQETFFAAMEHAVTQLAVGVRDRGDDDVRR